ncbi:MAG: ribosomal RNA small subunit methyltransferase A [Elusimicrobia bacterium]|nr:ribosomal RNA small subunit methyltransferase A [Elusimicrobiota bacterium]
MGARLGQHFLKREDVADSIVAAAGLSPGKNVVEIGPGPGILTGRLLATGAGVTAIEYDERLFEPLAARYKDELRLKMIRSDFLELDLDTLPKPCSFVANLPYAVATPILQRILAWQHWDRAVLMFQKEVALRIVAEHGSRKYGILSVSVALHAKARLVCDVSRECFAPRPDVESAVVRVDRSPAALPQGVDAEQVLRVVKAAFGQRRKQAANAISHALGITRVEAEKALGRADVAPLARAEEISLEGFVGIASALAAP